MDTEVCRICITKAGKGPSLFEPYESLYLPNIIKDISGIEVNAADGNTQLICENCLKLLIGAFDIRNKCIESDIYFKTMHDRSKTKSSTESPSQDIDKIKEQSPYRENDFESELDKYMKEAEKGFYNENIAINTSSPSCSEEEEENDDYLYDPSKSTKNKDHIYECMLCNKKFNNETCYIRHHKYHNQPKIKCPICPKEFSHKSNLKRHLVAVHKDKKALICDKCQMIFDDSTCLYEHLKSHKKGDVDRDEYKHECDMCLLQTPSLAIFIAHMKEKHNVKKLKPFKCRICSMGFASKQGMFRHVDNIHENNRLNLRNKEKNFLCNTCGKKFYTNFHLQVHTRCHSGERPFKCKYCEKSFAQLSGLKMHTYIHTGERPFSCKICGKTFNQYGHVKEHILTHSEEKPHVCSICNHSFRVKGNLTAHMLIHSGKKPHACVYCGKSFAQSTKLKSHIQRNHNTSES